VSAPFRFGLVGAGSIAETHARALAASAEADLVAVAGGRAAPDFAVRHGVAVEASPDALLARGDLDGLIVCTPSGARRDLVVAAAERGLHVLVEKPIEVTVARADVMIRACDAAGVTLGVVFQARFAPGVVAAAQAVRAGALGTPVLGEIQVAWYRPPAYYASGAWRGSWALDGGGALMNQGIHAVDQLVWLMGDVAEVSARATRRLHQGLEVEDTVVASLAFTSGALGTLSASTACAPGWVRRTEACGTAGSIRLVDDRIERWDVDAPQPTTSDAADARAPATGPTLADAGPHRAQIEEFVRAVRSGVRPRVDGREGLRSLALVEAVYRSAAEGGRPVAIAD
jgi:predicted dehydrogenase